jgi:hypothetical protein
VTARRVVLVALTTLALSAPAAAAAQSFDSLSCGRSGSLCVAVSPAGYATTYKRGAWTRPALIDASAHAGASELNGVSCGSASLCVAFDNESGDIFTDRGGSWSAPAAVDPDGGGVQALSCVSSSFCLAVDYAGQALTYDGSRWSTPGPAYTAGTLAALSCASRAFCIGGDDLGNVVEGTGGAWGTPTDLASGDVPVDAVSCPTRAFCVAAVGGALVPYVKGSWRRPTPVRGNGITALSCTTAPLCLAIDGGVLAGGGRRWRRVAAQLTGPRPISVSCSASSCVELDAAGNAVRDDHGVWSELATIPGGRAFRPAGLVTVGRVKSTGPVARIPVHCLAAACRLTFRVRLGSTVLGAVSRRLSAGRHMRMKLELGSSGRRALRRDRSLSVDLVVVEAGRGAILRRRLMFTS